MAIKNNTMTNYPKTIKEVVERIENGTLHEGERVGFLRRIGDYNTLVRIMTSIANSGGGVIILGVLEDKNGVLTVWGLPTKTINDVKAGIKGAILDRIRNLDNWEVKHGTCLGHEIACVFVRPSSKGMTYLYSPSDHLNRSYLYRVDDAIFTDRAQYHKLYKYMTIDAFIAGLEGESWRFWEPNRWADNYEKRFYCANYHRITNDPEIVQRVYATCLTRTRNNEAAWKVYVGKEGLQAHCVQLEINTEVFLDKLLESGYRIFERRVKYLDEYQIQTLHKETSNRHVDYFGGFNFNMFLNLLALKRDAYGYENEVRFFALDQKPLPRSTGKKAECINIKMDWANVIRSIRIDSKCSDSELIAMRYSCASNGIDLQIKGKPLSGKVTLPLGSKPVEAVLFNIDDMPGSKSITIQP